MKAQKKDWLSALPTIMMSLRCIPTVNGVSPFTALTGSELLMPSVLLTTANQTSPKSNQISSETLRKLSEFGKQFEFIQQPTRKSNQKSYIPADLKNCSHVWIRVDRVRTSLVQRSIQGLSPKRKNDLSRNA